MERTCNGKFKKPTEVGKLPTIKEIIGLKKKVLKEKEKGKKKLGKYPEAGYLV